MKHPEPADLALYSGGDLGALARWRVGAHVRRCEDCRREAAAFRSAAVAMRELGDPSADMSEVLPPDVHWNRLAAEMRANIRLGLAAGECVAPAAQPSTTNGWRTAMVMACTVLVMMAGWWLQNLPGRIEAPAQQVAGEAVVPGIFLNATSTGIALTENGRVLSLMHPSDPHGATVSTVSLEGSMRARYVDAQTGQVTINNVYVQ